MKSIYVSIALILLTVCLGCKSHDDSTPNPSSSSSSTETSAISFHLHTYIGQNEVDLLNTVYRTDDNRAISVGFAQLYISNIKLVKLDGSIYPIPDTTILTDIDDQVYKLGNVPIGNYKSVSFDVGLPSAINAKVPTGSPAKLNNVNMWFSNTAEANNYVFMHVAGKIDTSVAKSGANDKMASFEYKIGTQSRLVHVAMPDQNVAVQPGYTAFIHIIVDYAELFDGVTINNPTNLSVETIADNAGTLAINIASNIQKMFRYENQ
jgi:hypothetical protein